MFDLFILSDTRKPEIGAAEEVAWRAFVERQGGKGRIFYRRREQNTGRKAGNIADFVRSWGGAYDYAVVLDADSIMTGNSLVTLAGLMDKHPEAGIMQALPMPAGRETLFARLIQFAARLNSPMLANGLVYWQLGEGNYWGHNAILRLRQFAEFCDLPKLPGKPPLGGEILSHDFVEAAFMRRAGYQVWLAADVGGSWEEVPSNVIDYAARDRRWAQGNLQHLGLLPMRGLHWLSRIHLITGVLSYATLADLARGVGVELRHRVHGSDAGLSILRARLLLAVPQLAGVARHGDRGAPEHHAEHSSHAEGAGSDARAGEFEAAARLRRRLAARGQCVGRANLQHAAGAVDDDVSHHVCSDHAHRQVGDLECAGPGRPRHHLSRCLEPPQVARAARD